MDDCTKKAVLALVLRPHVKTPDGQGKIAANVILNDVFAMMSERSWSIPELTECRPDFVEVLSDIVYLRASGYITTKHVKTLLVRAWDVVGLDLVSELRDSKILEEVGTDQISAVVDKVLSENQKIVEQIRGGKTNAIGALIGKTMKEIGGKGNPSVVRDVVIAKLG